ncbi:hypothetical protein ES703_51661 [subsurface metagenome]
MKRVLTIFAFCLLASAILLADDPPAAGPKPVDTAGNKNSPARGLLRTDANNVVIREVLGRGPDRNQAIKNALYTAVAQVRGVKVDSGSYEFAFRGAAAGITAEQPDGRRIEFGAVDVATKGTAYTTEIGGLVKTYDVLEEKQIDEGTYQVKLKVAVYDYAARGDTKRVKIALMPVKTLKNSYPFLGLSVPADDLAALFAQRLAVGLTQTNKFAVMDRESISDFVREKRMLLSSDAPLGEQAKLAETLGADYLLVGTISEAKIEKIERYLQVADYTTRKFKARFAFNYRLIDSLTKQIAFASVAQKYLENEQVRELADEQNPAEWDPAQVRDAFISVVANDVIETIIDRVYPIRVVAVQQDGRIILNQGGDKMSEGMLLDIFTESEELLDYDTKESLGRIENLIATVKVNRVAQKISFAEVVDGDLSKISKGLICRVKNVKKDYDVGMKPDIIRDEKGGVKLPFDK